MIGKLLTTAEVAQRLGISPRTVTRMARAGVNHDLALKPAETVPGGRGVLLFDPDDVARLEAEYRKAEAPVAARALREAADVYAEIGPGLDRKFVSSWLRRRADTIERGEPNPPAEG